MSFFWCFKSAFLLVVVLTNTLTVASKYSVEDYQPTQIHIAFGNTVSDIVVTWVTTSKTKHSVVEYGLNGLIDRAEGNQTLFRDGGKLKRKFYIHRVLLPNLIENATYEYHCGSNLGWSELLFFRTSPKGSDWSPSFAIYGDMGAVNAQSLPFLQTEAQSGMYNAIFHVGDFAYDLDSDNGEIGNEFMRQIQPIAAHVPYMTAVGNHEEKYNFSHYRNRFSMPGDTQGLFYSFNIGPIHFVVFSTEFYYFLNYGVNSLITQYNWLRKDLKEASAPENRTVRPWIITLGHRPMYCSNDDKDDCTFIADSVRVGLPPFISFGLEDLFYRYGVDVEIWGHEHSYERTWPLYNYKIYNGSTGVNPYHNPGAPVHIITGSAGCNEYVDHFKSKLGDWSAFHSSDYGYTRMKAYNKTHLYFEQVSVDKDGLVIDNFWIVKDFHKSYLNLKKN
ncbi:acid phosphatase precursor, putative [Pediculus humanus corporis]|uniref:Purple acid phosphatase n=1 Tax=Pediculus humanus subsp. corporis TaxID=121224 RepID=E0VL88_PEDHC|nr:acid phosphatase precursor, putative [Pediculus humanus corporis]EEB14144.1 acid phosphatase precursor, putative [Pediculus humanus corporis]